MQPSTTFLVQRDSRLVVGCGEFPCFGANLGDERGHTPFCPASNRLHHAAFSAVDPIVALACSQSLGHAISRDTSGLLKSVGTKLDG
jgi:hypothetical protein